MEFVWLPTFDSTAEGLVMVLAYGKNVKDDLTEAQRAELKELASIIKKGRN